MAIRAVEVGASYRARARAAGGAVERRTGAAHPPAVLDWSAERAATGRAHPSDRLLKTGASLGAISALRAVVGASGRVRLGALKEEKLRRAWAGGAATPRATVRATVDIVASARFARVPMRLRATRAPTNALPSAAARATAVGTRALRLQRAIVAVEPGRAWPGPATLAVASGPGPAWRPIRAVDPEPAAGGSATGAGANALYSARATRAPVRGRDVARATRAVDEGRGAEVREALRVSGRALGTAAERDESDWAAERETADCAQPVAAVEPPVSGRVTAASVLRASGPGPAMSIAPALKEAAMRGRVAIAARAAWVAPPVRRAIARSTGAARRARREVDAGPAAKALAVGAPVVLRDTGLATAEPTKGEPERRADRRAGDVRGLKPRGESGCTADAAVARARGRVLAR